MDDEDDEMYKGVDKERRYFLVSRRIFLVRSFCPLKSESYLSLIQYSINMATLVFILLPEYLGRYFLVFGEESEEFEETDEEEEEEKEGDWAGELEEGEDEGGCADKKSNLSTTWYKTWFRDENWSSFSPWELEFAARVGSWSVDGTEFGMVGRKSEDKLGEAIWWSIVVWREVTDIPEFGELERSRESEETEEEDIDDETVDSYFFWRDNIISS